MTNHVETKSCQRDDQSGDSISSCDHRLLGDILWNQLLVSHSVAIFSVVDHHDSYGRYAMIASGLNKQNEHVSSLDMFGLSWRTFIEYQQLAWSDHGYVHWFVVCEHLVILMTFSSTDHKLVFSKSHFNSITKRNLQHELDLNLNNFIFNITSSTGKKCFYRLYNML